MAKKAIIVESPAKTRTLSSFVGRSYKLLASMGNVRDLPEHEFGVDVDNGFEPTYVTIPQREKVVADLKRELKGVDEVYLATDPDREGEAIAWHLAQVLALKDAKRIHFNEITREAVLEALESPGDIDSDLVSAQQARRILDRLVGYQISPLLSRRLKAKALSAGRVQSVALRLICDRERAIAAFVSREYWSIEAELTPSDREAPFTAKLVSKDGEDVELPDEQTTTGVVESLRGLEYSVSAITRKEQRRNPYPPFITSTLQQQAARKLGFSARQTMMVAQQLYEGIELGPEGSVGLITYMRTDSTRISDTAKGQASAFITKAFGEEYVGGQVRRAQKKGVQDAHEAIRPTAVERRPEDVRQYLSEGQFGLYTLVWQRFVASQMAAAVFDVTTVDVAAGPYGLRATGSIVKFPGFQKLYEEERDEDRDEEDEAAKLLPDLREGELLRLLELNPEQHFTKPPPRYTEATLVRELEHNGIGRPSTYAPTIDVLRQRKYVLMQSRRFVPTPLGLVVCDFLVQHFPDLMEVEFTATMEAGLDTVERGERDWVALVGEFHRPLVADLEAAKQASPKRLEEKCPECGGALLERMNVHGKYACCEEYPKCEFTRAIDDPALPSRSRPEPLDEQCPECGSQLQIRDGRRGKFIGCSGYPKCNYTRPVGADPAENGAPTPTGVTCAQCGKPMVARNGKRGPFLGCSGYPQCRFTMNLDQEGKPVPPARAPAAAEADEVGETCEQCGKPMLVRRARRGAFLGCSGYPECRNTKPVPREMAQRMRPKAEPTDETCPECGSPMVVRSGRRGEFLGCSKFPKCRHTRDLDRTAASPTGAGGE